MIRKIQKDEYLQRFDKMTVAERQSYKDRVGQWLRSGGRLLTRRLDDPDTRLQNVVTVSVSWNDAECQAFEEGARLLSALVNSADTWLPDLLYAKAARRCAQLVISRLTEIVEAQAGGDAAVPEDSVLSVKRDAGNTGKAGERNRTAAAVSKPTNTMAGTKAEVTTDGVTKVMTDSIAAVPPRPKHIDQYVHLLPVKTQERAAKVKDLLRELDYAREKARLLMGSPQASRDVMAAWAKKATACDNAVRSIYKELDAEWEELVKSGRVVVDIFGNARISEESRVKSEESSKELTSEQKHRRRELRKWLIDTRRGAEGKARQKRIEQWKENWKEYMALETLDAALKDEKIVTAARHFGIDLGGGTAALPQFTEREKEQGSGERGNEQGSGERGKEQKSGELADEGAIQSRQKNGGKNRLTE